MALKEIVPGLFEISMGIVNVFLIDGDDGLTLIDTGVAGSYDKILAAIEALDRRPLDIQQILLPHCHGDHTGSLAAFVPMIQILYFVLKLAQIQRRHLFRAAFSHQHLATLKPPLPAHQRRIAQARLSGQAGIG